MRCFIYDFSTLSTDPLRGVVSSMAFFEFESQNFTKIPYQFDKVVESCKFVKFDVKDQVKRYGRGVQPETLEFWKQRPQEQHWLIKPSNRDMPIALLPRALEKLVDFRGIDKVFTRSNTFDPLFMRSIYRDLDEPFPFEEYKERDIVSYIDGLSYGADINPNFIPEKWNTPQFNPQDPRQSIAMDIMRIQEIAKYLEEDEDVSVPF